MQEEIKLYSALEVSKMLSVSKDYVYDKVNEGKLRCYRVGNKRMMFSLEQIKDFLDHIEINKD